MKVCIIGGGPSGLVTLKTLLESKARFNVEIEPILLEAHSEIGGIFRQGYENVELVSSKHITCFSDFRLPLERPDYMGFQDYLDYLARYCTYFNLWPNIRLSCHVARVERDPDRKGHKITYLDQSTSKTSIVQVDALAICTGLHASPWMPKIEGLENLKATGVKVLHSSQYQCREQVQGKRVLVVGSGETAMDLVYESIKSDCPEVVLCHRSGWLSIPKVLSDFRIFGFDFKGALPIDGLITNLFETCYVHPWIAASRLRWHMSDMLLQWVLWFLTGTRAGVNQWAGELERKRRGRAYVFLNKSSKAMPYINRKYKPSNRWMERVATYIDPDDPLHGTRAVDLAPPLATVLPSGQVLFQASNRKEAQDMKDRVVVPEVVIFATGYTQDFSWLDSGGGYPNPADADIRGVCRSGDESVAFVGFQRPGIGAIPPIAELQAMLWTLLLLGRINAPTDPPHYRLLQSPKARIQYGVDFGAYMSTLARDIGGSPAIFNLLKTHGIKTTVSYCFGAAFVPYYRLCGPFADPNASCIAKGELWEAITRRGFLGNIIFGLIPMITYGIINLCAWAISSVITI